MRNSRRKFTLFKAYNGCITSEKRTFDDRVKIAYKTKLPDVLALKIAHI
jgi:hypothetical protein